MNSSKAINTTGNQGFTLIELLGVILITAILAAGALAIVRSPNGSKKRKAGIDQVRAVLSLARTKAITRAQPVAVAILPNQASLPDTGSCKYCVVGLRLQPDGSFKLAERLGKWRSLPEGVVWATEADGDLASILGLELETISLDVPGSGTRDFQLVIFGRSGEILSPTLPAGRASLAVVNGAWNGNSIVYGGRDADASLIRETLIIRAATGRVRALR